jgi:hypothetical protein
MDEKVLQTFNQKLLPILQRFDPVVVGFLAPPSSIKLAVTDLSQPMAVFCYATVKDEPKLYQLASYMGLPSTVFDGEGLVSTLDGWTWPGD